MSSVGMDLLSEQYNSWSSGIPSEIAFWSNWVATKGGRWGDDYMARMSASTVLRSDLADIARLHPDRRCKILDVGAGPVSNIGFQLPDVEIEIIAVDPLASFYADIFEAHGLKPPLETQFATAEDLTFFFDHNSMDVVHCTNALDHSFDPIRGVEEMVKVAKPGGTVLLIHHENEALMEDYEGFHQHNFTARDGKFIIWNQHGEVDVGEALGSKVRIAASLSGETVDKFTKRAVIVRIEKLHSTYADAAELRVRTRSILEASVKALGQSMKHTGATP